MPKADPNPIPVVVLGATGLVGQRLVHLLASHPWFRLAGVAASDRSAGKPYAEAVRWRLPGDPPPAAAGLIVAPPAPDRCDAALAFSALDAAIAETVEPAFARAGRVVVSNTRCHRMDPDVPLLIPEINAPHLAVVEAQRRRWGGGGFVVCNPNCSVIGLALALAPLHALSPLRRVVVTTLQAVSGAGYPGVPALDIVDNAIPYISGEEEKIEIEPPKIFGAARDGRIASASIAVSSHVHRVAVSDGHLAAVSVETERPIAPEEAATAMRVFRGAPEDRRLPSAPRVPVVVRDEPDRPQPRLDRQAGEGMSAVVGKLRRCPVLGLRFEVLSHNTLRGAAGGTLLIGEMLHARGMLP